MNKEMKSMVVHLIAAGFAQARMIAFECVRGNEFGTDFREERVIQHTKALMRIARQIEKELEQEEAEVEFDRQRLEEKLAADAMNQQGEE